MSANDVLVERRPDETFGEWWHRSRGLNTASKPIAGPEKPVAQPRPQIAVPQWLRDKVARERKAAAEKEASDQSKLNLERAHDGAVASEEARWRIAYADGRLLEPGDPDYDDDEKSEQLFKDRPGQVSYVDSSGKRRPATREEAGDFAARTWRAWQDHFAREAETAPRRGGKHKEAGGTAGSALDARKDAPIKTHAPAGKRQRYAAVSSLVYGIRKGRPLIRGPEFRPSLCSASAMKVVWYALLHVDGLHEDGFAPLRLSAHALGREINAGGAMSRARASALLTAAAGVVFMIRDAKGEEDNLPAVRTHFAQATGQAEITVLEHMRPFLLGRLGKFRKLYPAVLRLRSAYALQLYFVLRAYAGRRIKRHRLAIGDLYEAMQVDKAMPWKAFHRLLKAAVAELNAPKTELVIRYEVERGMGRRVRGGISAITFTLKERLPPKKAPKAGETSDTTVSGEPV